MAEYFVFPRSNYFVVWLKHMLNICTIVLATGYGAILLLVAPPKSLEEVVGKLPLSPEQAQLMFHALVTLTVLTFVGRVSVEILDLRRNHVLSMNEDWRKCASALALILDYEDQPTISEATVLSYCKTITKPHRFWHSAEFMAASLLGSSEKHGLIKIRQAPEFKLRDPLVYDVKFKPSEFELNNEELVAYLRHEAILTGCKKWTPIFLVVLTIVLLSADTNAKKMQAVFFTALYYLFVWWRVSRVKGKHPFL